MEISLTLCSEMVPQFGGDTCCLGFLKQKVELTLLGEGSWWKRYVLRQKTERWWMTSQHCQDNFTDSFVWDGQNCEGHLAWFGRQVSSGWTDLISSSFSGNDWEDYLPYAPVSPILKWGICWSLHVSPQISYVEILTPKGDCIKYWAGRGDHSSCLVTSYAKTPMTFLTNPVHGVFGKLLGHEGTGLVNGISALIKGIPQDSLAPSTMWGHSKKAVSEPGLDPCWHPDHGLPNLPNWRKDKLPGPWYFIIEAPKQTKAAPNVINVDNLFRVKETCIQKSALLFTASYFWTPQNLPFLIYKVKITIHNCCCCC